MSENITVVTNDSFEAEVLHSSIPVLVDFWAEWCGPCKMLVPALEAVAKDFVGKIKVAKVNVDENNLTAMTYEVRGIPNLILFKNGKVAARKVGAMTKAQLADFVTANL